MKFSAINLLLCISMSVECRHTTGPFVADTLLRSILGPLASRVFLRGVEQWLARMAHNHQVAGSNPASATSQARIT